MGSNPTLSANISLQTNEMGLKGPENPLLPRRFPSGARTSETTKGAKIGLCLAFVSFHPNLTVTWYGQKSQAILPFCASMNPARFWLISAGGIQLRTHGMATYAPHMLKRTRTTFDKVVLNSV